MEEGNALADSRFTSEIRWLVQAGLLVFAVTVSVSILNRFHLITLRRQVRLPFLLGVLPLQSSHRVEFTPNELPGSWCRSSCATGCGRRVRMASAKVWRRLVSLWGNPRPGNRVCT